MKSPYAPFALLIGLLVIAAGIAVIFQQEPAKPVAGLQSFNSYSELNLYLDQNGGSKGLVSAPTTDQSSMSSAAPEHSTTNIQVSGVQEEDRVVTDGTYIYSAGQTIVSIINAAPASDMRNISSLNMSHILDAADGTSVQIMGIYLIGNDLVVICQQSSYSQAKDVYTLSLVAPSYQAWAPRSTVSVFDVTDVTAPKLVQTSGVSGSFSTSRAHGNDLFIFASQYAWDYSNGNAVVPTVMKGSSNAQFEPGQIFYNPGTSEIGCFLNVIRLNIADQSSEHVSFLTGYSSVLYVSENSIFVTYPHYSYYALAVDDGSDVAVSSISQNSPYTTVYKIDIAGAGLELKAVGTVRGTVVDRYAMDEKDGYLRIATTDFYNGTQTLVSVLSSNLTVVGQIGGIGVGETMESSRYINDTLYLVTFRQVDPLFAIDLSDPTAPRILGELTMPGFSSYLHPADETHLIGLGFEGHGMKVSLYNVSDRTHPVEVQKLLLADFSYSPALYDPHAVMYDRSRSLLVVPVSGYEEGSYKFHCAAYVFNTSGGITLVGTAGSNNSGGVDRTMYIGDSLYVCSQYSISVYGITDLEYRGSIVLGTYQPYWYGYAGNGAEPVPMAPGEIK